MPKIGTEVYAGLKHRHLLNCVEGLRHKSKRVSVRVNEHMLGMSGAIERERVMAQTQKRRFDVQEVRRSMRLVDVAWRALLAGRGVPCAGDAASCDSPAEYAGLVRAEVGPGGTCV